MAYKASMRSEQAPAARACMLCGGEERAHLYTTQGRFYSFNRVRARFVVCTRCGLARREGAATPHAHDAARISVYGSPRKSRQQVARIRRALGEPAWSGATLVDVGCRAGNLVASLAAAFPESNVIGLEPDSTLTRALERDKPSDRITILDADLEAYAARNPIGIKAVFMMTVLEHLEDPCAALAAVRRMLERDGVLVLQVPDLDELGPLGPEYFFRDFHVYYYTHATLTALLSHNGFSVVERLHGPSFSGGGVPFLSLIARRDDSVDPVLPAGEALRVRASIDRAVRDARIRAPVRYAIRHWLRAPVRRALARARYFFAD